eukprot:TRINITY_DN14763_c0_g3_i1.p1 TRINITY_DN14763_c0_g3~~TRINITY_DN14763_c0_g3_i1.p1  ORF type:complete len:1260 (-),score=145.51 TRINITY_DN14763_c0_g3_i1:55-3294(-)
MEVVGRKTCAKLLAFALFSGAMNTWLAAIALLKLLSLATSPAGDPRHNSLTVVFLCFVLPMSGAVVRSFWSADERNAAVRLVLAFRAASIGHSDGESARKHSDDFASQWLHESNAVDVVCGLLRAMTHVFVIPLNAAVVMVVLWMHVGVAVGVAIAGCVPFAWVTERMLQSVLGPSKQHAAAKSKRCALVASFLDGATNASLAIKCGGLQKSLLHQTELLRSEESEAAAAMQLVGFHAASLSLIWPRMLALLALSLCLSLETDLATPQIICCLQLLSGVVCGFSTFAVSSRKLGGLFQSGVALEDSLRRSLVKNPAAGEDGARSQTCVEGACEGDREVLTDQSAEGDNRDPCVKSDPVVDSDLAASKLLGRVPSSTSVHGAVLEGEAQREGIPHSGSTVEESRASVGALRKLPRAVLARVAVCAAFWILGRFAELFADTWLVRWAWLRTSHPSGRHTSALIACQLLSVVALLMAVAANIIGVKCGQAIPEVVHRRLWEGTLAAPPSHFSDESSRQNLRKLLTADMSRFDTQFWPRIACFGTTATSVCCMLAYVVASLSRIGENRPGGMAGLGLGFSVEQIVAFTSCLPAVFFLLVYFFNGRVRYALSPHLQSDSDSESETAAVANARALSLRLCTCVAAAYTLFGLDVCLHPAFSGMQGASVQSPIVALPTRVGLAFLFLALLPQAIDLMIDNFEAARLEVSALIQASAVAGTLPVESIESHFSDPTSVLLTLELSLASRAPLRMECDSLCDPHCSKGLRVCSWKGELLFRASVDCTSLVVEAAVLATLAEDAELGSCGDFYVATVNGNSYDSARRMAEELVRSSRKAQIVVRSGWLCEGALLEMRNVRAPGIDLPCELTSVIQAREHVGLAGPAGSCSSLIFAMLRIVELESGTVLLGGRDITQVGLQALRSAMMCVPSEGVLFSDVSIRAHIDPLNEASDHDLVQALKRLQLGYLADGGLGEPASSLAHASSSSIARRLCFVRAVLLQLPLVLIDAPPPTASPHEAEEARALTHAARMALLGSTVLEVVCSESSTCGLQRMLTLSADQTGWQQTNCVASADVKEPAETDCSSDSDVA